MNKARIDILRYVPYQNPIVYRDPNGSEYTLVETTAALSVRDILAVTVVSTATAIVITEPPIRLYRYTTIENVEAAKSIGYVIASFGVTWWTDTYYIDPLAAQNFLSLKYRPRAWLSVLICPIKDWLLGPTKVAPKPEWGTIGSGVEYWTFKAIPFWSRSPMWGYY